MDVISPPMGMNNVFMKCLSGFSFSLLKSNQEGHVNSPYENFLI